MSSACATTRGRRRRRSSPRPRPARPEPPEGRLSARLGGEFLRFCLVGAVGFVVDAGALEAFVRLDIAGLYVGRVLSYILAASVTWWLNARFTFRSPGRWDVYVATNALGAGINYGVYVAALWLAPALSALPSIAVAAGSAVALLVNFVVNRWLVFRPNRDP